MNGVRKKRVNGSSREWLMMMKEEEKGLFEISRSVGRSEQRREENDQSRPGPGRAGQAGHSQWLFVSLGLRLKLLFAAKQPAHQAPLPASQPADSSLWTRQTPNDFSLGFPASLIRRWGLVERVCTMTVSLTAKEWNERVLCVCNV